MNARTHSKLTLATCALLWIYASPALSQAIPEPGLVLYGVVKNIANNSARLTYGTLRWTIQPPAGPPITLPLTLSNVNDQFSYVVQVPFESPLTGVTVSSGALTLSSTPASFTRSATVNFIPATILGSALPSFTFGSADRGRMERVDLQVTLPLVDIDGDGLDDNWELAYFGNLSQGATGDFDGDGITNLAEFRAGSDPTKLPPATIEGRFVFYNNSAWDGKNLAANALDDAAIATDKAPLLPGGIATFANYTSYSRGINGVMVDVSRMGGTPVASDFVFNVGNDNTPSGWVSAPTPTSVTVRSQAGVNGSDRITIVWPDNAIQKQWLEVNVLATTTTRLSNPDVFYFGNAIGDSGNSPLNAQVDVTDQNAVRQHPRNFLNPAPITSPYDYNRDKRVDVSDENVARVNKSNFLNALKLINLSQLSGLANVAVARVGTGSRSSEVVLEINIMRQLGDGFISLVWQGASPDRVSLESTEDLRGGRWETLDLPEAEQTAEGTWRCLVPMRPGDVSRFFRVLQSPQY